ncbi:MAG: hypothetical protein R3F62_18045 [Planctomycetota bacterium]
MSQRGLLLALLLSLLLVGSAGALEIQGKVASVRGKRVYVELDRPLKVEVGTQVEVGTKDAPKVASVVVAISTQFLVVEAGEAGLARGDAVTLTLNMTPPPEREPPPPPPEDIQIRRKVITLRAFRSQPLPKREPVPFVRGNNRREDAELAAGEDAPPPPPPTAGEEPEEEVQLANVVRGHVEVGVDSAFDSEVGINRVTPFARLSLEVSRLGGNDRARFFFYGMLRKPFDGVDDWTGHNEERPIARFSAAVLEIDAAPEGAIHSLSDRFEFAIGRSTIPGSVEAGIVDGARFGIRMGPVIGFGFAGAAVSPNPQIQDYDSVIYGGGIRFSKSFPHSGAIQLSIVGAQERFRGEGERDFLEANMDVRYGSVGARGSLVLDLFDQLRDKQKTRLTTGMLSVYAQLSSAVRIEAGFRERRPAYSGDLLARPRLIRGASDLDPLIAPFLDHDERRNLWTALNLRFSAGVRLGLRGEVLTAPESRDVYGGVLTFSKDGLIAEDRITFQFAFRHRLRGDGITRHVSDPYVSFTYAWFGETVDFDGSIYYRTSVPSIAAGDSRFGLRLGTWIRATDRVSLRGYGSVEVRRAASEIDPLYFLGFAVRYGF